ncbi:unnamed protein product [Allacma fusca]|uniref:Uncharacterized protein n=1 Tax=Allacma fusca TaxID=39272 RepID=A0A8J2PG82_9HEXA|nr:unnamed protein product [Allacma fusca]
MNKPLLKSVFICLLLQYSVVLATELELNNTEIALNLLEDLDNWEAPKDVQSFRYYLTGVDDECRPSGSR